MMKGNKNGGQQNAEWDKTLKSKKTLIGNNVKDNKH